MRISLTSNSELDYKAPCPLCYQQNPETRPGYN